MKIAEFFAQNAFSPDVDIDALLVEFDRQMDAGLAGGKSSLAMIPAYVDADRAVKTDTPINVLDAGGTNLRVATVRFDKAGKAKIEGLSPDVVQSAAGTLKPEALTWVVVGDLSKIEEGVRALDLGEVQVVDADGKPVAAKK